MLDKVQLKAFVMIVWRHNTFNISLIRYLTSVAIVYGTYGV